MQGDSGAVVQQLDKPRGHAWEMSVLTLTFWLTNHTALQTGYLPGTCTVITGNTAALGRATLGRAILGQAMLGRAMLRQVRRDVDDWEHVLIEGESKQHVDRLDSMLEDANSTHGAAIRMTLNAVMMLGYA
eukprot:122516-Rhodomonas_salina.1